MITKILCFIGWHAWTWRLRNVDEQNGVKVTETITDEIPNRAICKHCKKQYIK